MSDAPRSTPQSTPMSDEAELIKLYSGQILGLAANLTRTDRLENPDGSAHRRAPLCGSTVTVDLKVQDGKISDFGHDVKTCALGQASSSIMAQQVLGTTLADIRKARAELHAMLSQNGPPPAAPFEALKVLLPARDYKNRHASILLTFDATIEALEKAEKTQAD